MGHGHQIYIYCVQMNLENVFLMLAVIATGHRTHRHPLNLNQFCLISSKNSTIFYEKKKKTPALGNEEEKKRFDEMNLKRFSFDAVSKSYKYIHNEFFMHR